MSLSLVPGRASALAAASLALAAPLAVAAPASAAACPIDVASYGRTLAAANRALDAVTSRCRSLVLSPGTYTFSSSWIINSDKVTIVARPGAVIKAAPGARLREGLVKVTGDGVSLTGLTLQGSGAHDGIRTSGRRTSITGGSISVGGRAVFLLPQADDATLRACRVTRSGDRGIATMADRTTIEGCRVSGVRGTGIWTFGSAQAPNVVRNDVFGNGDKGIEFSGANGFTAAGNLVHDNAKLGIHLLRSRGGVVKDNAVYRNDSNGIDLHGAVNVTISNNRAFLNGGPRWPRKLEGQGILVYCSTDIRVLGNRVWNNAQGQAGKRNGISVSDTNGAKGELRTRRILIDNNLVYDDQARSTQNYGIRLGGPTKTRSLDHLTVTNNRGWGNLEAGIYTGGLVRGARATIRNNKL